MHVSTLCKTTNTQHRVPKTFSDSNPQQKEVKKNKGKKRKKETSDEESSEDEIQINMGTERVLQENEKQHLTSNPWYFYQ